VQGDRRKDNRPTCSHCDKRGHKSAKCWILHPELAPEHTKQEKQQPSRSSKKGSERATRAQHDSSGDDESSHGWAGCTVFEEEDGDDGAAHEQAAATASASPPASKPDEEKVTVHSRGIKGNSLETDWLVDSAASLHYCHERDMFDAFEPVKGKHVILGDGRRIPVTGRGTLKVTVPVFGGLSAGTLTNVQYTPDMAVNLLSVPSLTSAGLEVRFKDRDCTIRKGRKVIARASKVANKLYQLTIRNRAAMAVVGVGSEPARPVQTDRAGLAQLWHQRMDTHSPRRPEPTVR
jgi:hypothetical protein